MTGESCFLMLPRSAAWLAEGTVLHLAKIVKDPFFDAGLAGQGARLQTGIGIRRWTPATVADELLWDPFNFLNPITERTDAATSDPGSYSGMRSPVPCSASVIEIHDLDGAGELLFADIPDPVGAVAHDHLSVDQYTGKPLATIL